MMSEELTIYATGLIDISNANQDFHISNQQNDNDVSSQAERNGFLRYPRIFLIEVLVPFQKMKKQLVVCGDTEKVDPIMAVVMQTWYLQTVG